MASLPPLPPGFVLESGPQPKRDPWAILQAEGFVATNGYRTEGDVERIRAQGYTPAKDGAHNRGDGVDLNHPRLNRTQQKRRLEELFGDWDGAVVLDEGHHRHLALPGWGAAPGTPGTPNSGLPPLPPGFELQQRGSLQGGNYVDEKAARIATLDQGLADGSLTPAEHQQWTKDVRDERAPIVDERGVSSTVVFNDQMPEQSTYNWTDEQRRAIQAQVGKVKTPEELQAFARSLSGGVASIGNAKEVLEQYRKTGKVGIVTDVPLPIPAKNRDGATGAAIRGLGDPFNFLDEMGAVADTLGTTSGRENIWNSERGFGDILYGNIDQNRGILKADERDHFAARFGGQLATNMLLPIGNKARGAAQLAKWGAAEGALAGFGAGEGNPLERSPNALLGAGMGATGGFVLGKAIEAGAPLVRRAFGRSTSEPVQSALEPVARESGYRAAPVVNDAGQAAGPTPAAKSQPQGGVVGRADAAEPNAPPEYGSLYQLSRPELERLAVMAPREADVDDGPISREMAAEMLREHQPYTDFDDANLVDVIRRTLIEQRDPRWLDRVGSGQGLPSEQAAFVRMMGSLDALKQRGKSLADLPADLASNLRERGWSAADVDEVLSSRLEGLRRPSTAAMANEAEVPMFTGPIERQRDYINLDDLPPLPPGFQLVDEPALARVRPMGEQVSPDDIAAAARSVYPEDVVPIPRNVVDETDELPSSLAQMEAPTSGRRAKKPSNLLDGLKGWTASESNAKGMAVRIDAEDAINRGVPAEYIYTNPNVADRSKLRLRNPSIFGTRFGTMSGTQQHLRSLDQLDIDPVDWGFDDLAGGRLEPDDVGDLLRRSFEGDETALQRGSAYDEWAGYNERVGQRQEFEARFPEGAVERRGEPIGPDDLKANEPPVTAYEDLPQVGGMVGNINLANVETRHDIRRLLQNVETKFGGFDAARRGKVTQGETAALARELGMTPDDLLRRRKGQALNAEQALAARQLLAKSADEVTALAQRMLDGPSDEQRAVFAKAIVRHAAIQEQLTAATAEAGRTLAQFKMAARSKAVGGRIHDNIINGLGGPDRLEKVAQGILDLQREGVDQGAVNKFALASLKPRKSDYLIEYYYNALLSGVSTHVVNSASNLATQLMQIPEYALAAGVGAVRSGVAKVAGREAAERVFLSEAGARAFGLVQGTKDGLKAFAKVMRTGDPTDPMTALEVRKHKAIPGVAGSIIRTPSRLLMAEDELFKATARRSSMAGLAVRAARNEGLKGEAAKARVAELVANPTDDMVEQSFQFARYLTFQTPLLKLGQYGTAALEVAPIFKLIFPFVRTPANLFKFALERVPGAQLAVKRVRDDYKAGGVRRDLAVARATFGAGIAATVMTYAAEGKVSGKGPSDPATRRTLMAGGWQPFSIKVGDKWFSYSRTDPFATLFGVSADLVTYDQNLTDKQKEARHVALLGSIMAQIESKTWLSGLSDFVQAMDDPGRFGESYSSRLVGSLVPTISAHAANSIDPVARETVVNGDFPASIANRVRSRIPGLSQSLPAQRDAWGQEVRREGGPAANLLSPFYMRTDKNDPVGKALLSAGIGMGRPTRTISDGMGGDRQLSPKEFDRYQELAGQYVREDINALLQEEGWGSLARGEQKKEIRKAVAAARKAAREELFEADDDARQAAPPLPPGFVALP